MTQEGAPPGWPPYDYPPNPYYPGPYGYYGDGPPGKIRPTGVSLLLFFCTFGIYAFFYNFSVHDEMRRHSGRGIGGGIALLLTFIANVAMPFVTPAEVGALYARKGWPPPVSGWTGLWSVGPMVIGYIAQFFIIFSTFATLGPGNNGETTFTAAFGIALAVWLICILVGGILWFTKTNNALNAYWQAVVPNAR